MIGWLRRRRYRNEALGCLMALTGKMRQGDDKALLGAYPNLPEAIEGCRHEGLTHEQAAMRLAAILVSDHIERLSTEERERLLADLDKTGVEPLAPGLGHLFYMADNWRRHGDVTEDEYETFRSEVVGALQGLDAQERSSQRIFASLRVGAPS